MLLNSLFACLILLIGIYKMQHHQLTIIEQNIIIKKLILFDWSEKCEQKFEICSIL